MKIKFDETTKGKNTNQYPDAITTKTERTYMKIIVIILSISTIYSAELFKGYIKIERHKWLFAEGEYENGGMNGKWSFYADSTKSIKVASGNYISGNKTRISKTSRSR